MANNTKLHAFLGVALGATFVYSGVKGKGFLSVLQTTVRGNNPKNAVPANQITDTGDLGTPIENQALIDQATGNTGAATQTAAQNQAIARVLATPFGWSAGQQWDCLVKLWNKESGWSNTAENASGAYGIAQALPNTKYPLPGQPPSAGGSADPTTQIAWGLTYILQRYGTPCNAWAHELANNWY